MMAFRTRSATSTFSILKSASGESTRTTWIKESRLLSSSLTALPTRSMSAAAPLDSDIRRITAIGVLAWCTHDMTSASRSDRASARRCASLECASSTLDAAILTHRSSGIEPRSFLQSSASDSLIALSTSE